MFNIVLLEPEIPANTGNIGRTCVVTGSRLHLIRPLGFSLDERALHRAGLGYWKSLDVVVHDSWDAFLAHEGLAGEGPEPRLHLFTKKARRLYTEAVFHDGDCLVLGKESSGLPEELLARYPEHCDRIPMLTDERALVNAEAWHETVAPEAEPRHEALRQTDICGNFINPDDYRISALNLSNAAAVAVYEALRQTGFAGIGDL